MSELTEFIHDRLKNKALDLYNHNFFTESAREALLQVEIALKEKFPFETDASTAVQFVNKFFIDDDKSKRFNKVKLQCKYGEQDKLKMFFNGVFSLYRNNLVHRDIDLNKIEGFRILIITSELLDLIDTSRISYLGINKLEGLIKMKLFKDKFEFVSFLGFIENQYVVDDMCDGFFEDLNENGFTEEQYHAVLDYGLVSFDVSKIDWSDTPLEYIDDYEEIGYFHLTELGKKEKEENS